MVFFERFFPFSFSKNLNGPKYWKDCEYMVKEK